MAQAAVPECRQALRVTVAEAKAWAVGAKAMEAEVTARVARGIVVAAPAPAKAERARVTEALATARAEVASAGTAAAAGAARRVAGAAAWAAAWWCTPQRQPSLRSGSLSWCTRRTPWGSVGAHL